MNHQLILTARKYLPEFLVNAIADYRNNQQLKKWHENGCPVPPPHAVKVKTIQEFAQKYGIKTLVETGTYRGAMIEAQRTQFDAIYSVEIDQKLHAAAQKRFEKHRHIHLIHGDSGEQLKKIVPTLTEPAIFWLDGHYSGGVTGKANLDTPINAELKTVLDAPQKHVVIIDDARDFNGTNDYPTIAEVESFVTTNYPNLAIENKHDLIRIYAVR